MKQINLKKYKILQDIGRGSFGEVKLIKEKKTGKLFAAKISKDPISDENIRNLRREMEICSRITHPSIVQFYGYSLQNFYKEPKPVIIMEYCQNKTLADFIDSERKSLSKWDDTVKLINIYSIASAMAFLHENNTIHRDLKPENILMDDDFCPKISDFGLAKIIHQNNDSISIQSTVGIKGTPIYISPESLENGEYSEKSDVYAYAFIVYEIITNEEPYAKCKKRDEIYRKVKNGIRPAFDIPIGESYKNLINRCWDQDPSNRPTFSEIIDELENDEGYITDLIDGNKYLQHIDKIKEFQKSFDKKKNIDIDSSNLEKSKKVSESKKSTKKTDNSLIASKKSDKKSLLSKQKIHETEILNSTSTNKHKIHETECIDEQDLYDSSVQNSLSRKDDSTNISKSTKLRKSKTLPKTFKDEPDEEQDLSKSSIFSSTKSQNKEKSKKFSLFKKPKPQKNIIHLPNDECNTVLREAENDAEKQFFVAKSFIEEKNNFPLDIENGISYLKRSIKGGCIDAVAYYCQMLIKGINIPKNLDKAKKTLKKHLKSKNSSIMFLYGKVKKKEGDNKTAAKYFKKSSDEGNPKAMYNLAKLLFTDNKYNIHQSNVNALTYFNMAKNNGYDKYNSFLSKQSADSIYQFGDLLFNKSSTNNNPEEAIKCFNIAVDKGNIKAMIKLANMYYSGEEVELDKRKAFTFFSMAANNGNVDSMLRSANMAYDGDGIPINKIDAVKYYKMAANKGSIEAMVKAANMFYKGDGVVKNSTEAFNFYKMAADKGSIDSMFLVAKMLFDGDGVESNKKEAYKYYKKSADKGNVESMYLYGNALKIGIDIGKNISEAAIYLKNAADKGHIEANFQYGILLKNGDGIPINISKSGYYLQIAANKGHLKAIDAFIYILSADNGTQKNIKEILKYSKIAADRDDFELREIIAKASFTYGYSLRQGFGIPKNIVEGTKYIKKAADIGSHEAVYLYACCLENGDGVPKNTKEACHYFQIAINQNDRNAMFHYAMIQYNGDGVLMNKQKACKFFKMAADNGSEQAMYMYAKCLEEGSGTERDIKEALKYYQKAFDNGCKAAEEKTKQLFNDRLQEILISLKDISERYICNDDDDQMSNPNINHNQNSDEEDDQMSNPNINHNQNSDNDDQMFNPNIYHNQNSENDDQMFNPNINHNQNSENDDQMFNPKIKRNHYSDDDKIFNLNLNYNQNFNDDHKINPNINSIKYTTEEEDHHTTEEKFNKTEQFDTEEKFYKNEDFSQEGDISLLSNLQFFPEEKFNKTEDFSQGGDYQIQISRQQPSINYQQPNNNYQQPNNNYQQNNNNYQQPNNNYQQPTINYQQQQEYHPTTRSPQPYSLQPRNQPFYQNETFNRSCTHDGTGDSYVEQPFYNCITCGLVGHLGCCEACARICHAGHQIVSKGWKNCYCDCGTGGIKSCVQCRCRKVPTNEDLLSKGWAKSDPTPPPKPLNLSDYYKDDFPVNYNQNYNKNQRFDPNMNSSDSLTEEETSTEETSTSEYSESDNYPENRF